VVLIKKFLVVISMLIVLPIIIFIWIPLLFRIITIIVYTAIDAALTGKKTQEVHDVLEEIIVLPITALKRVSTIVFNDSQVGTKNLLNFGIQYEIIPTLLIAFIFWLSTVLIWFVIFGSPFNLAKVAPDDVVAPEIDSTVMLNNNEVIDGQTVVNFEKLKWDEATTLRTYDNGRVVDTFKLFPAQVRYGSKTLPDTIKLKICSIHASNRGFGSLFVRHDFDTKVVIWEYSGDIQTFLQSECKYVDLINKEYKDKYLVDYGEPTNLRVSEDLEGSWRRLTFQDKLNDFK